MTGADSRVSNALCLGGDFPLWGSALLSQCQKLNFPPFLCLWLFLGRAAATGRCVAAQWCPSTRLLSAMIGIPTTGQGRSFMSTSGAIRGCNRLKTAQLVHSQEGELVSALVGERRESPGAHDVPALHPAPRAGLSPPCCRSSPDFRVNPVLNKT